MTPRNVEKFDLLPQILRGCFFLHFMTLDEKRAHTYMCVSNRTSKKQLCIIEIWTTTKKNANIKSMMLASKNIL